MAVRKLRETPKPESPSCSIWETEHVDANFVYIQGSGALDLTCGVCGHTLVRGANLAAPDQIIFPEMILNGRFVFYCNQCHSYNEIRSYLG